MRTFLVACSIAATSAALVACNLEPTPAPATSPHAISITPVPEGAGVGVGVGVGGDAAAGSAQQEGSAVGQHADPMALDIDHSYCRDFAAQIGATDADNAVETERTCTAAITEAVARQEPVAIDIDGDGTAATWELNQAFGEAKAFMAPFTAEQRG